MPTQWTPLPTQGCINYLIRLQSDDHIVSVIKYTDGYNVTVYDIWSDKITERYIFDNIEHAFASFNSVLNNLT